MKLEGRKAEKKGMPQKKRKPKIRISPWIAREQPPKRSFQTTNRENFLPLGFPSQTIRYSCMFQSSTYVRNIPFGAEEQVQAHIMPVCVKKTSAVDFPLGFSRGGSFMCRCVVDLGILCKLGAPDPVMSQWACIYFSQL